MNAFALKNQKPRESDKIIILENDRLSLMFSTGKWIGLYQKHDTNSRNLIEKPASKFFEIMIRKSISGENVTNFSWPGVQSRTRDINSGEWITDRYPVEWLGQKQTASGDGNSIFLSYRCQNYYLEVAYHLKHGSSVIRREITLKNKSRETVWLYEISLPLPVFRIGECEDDEIEIYDLKNSVTSIRGRTEDFPLKSRQPCLTAMDQDFHHEVSFVQHSPSANGSLFCWAASPEYEAVTYHTERRGKSLQFSPAWFPFCKLTSGASVYCSSQYIGTVAGGYGEIREQFKIMKTQNDWTCPTTPEFLDGAFIYQVHGFIADFGGFSGLEKLIPRLKKIGVDILYLPPLSGPEAYLNFEPDAISECYGTKDELKKLVREAHANGIRVIIDMIAHHIFRHCPVARNQNFIRSDELGAPLSYSIGSVLTETRNSDYQDYYIDCCRCLIEKYDLDGFRFDVAGFQLPNWNSNSGYQRPGMGVLGQTELLQNMHKELSKLKELIFLEEGMGVLGFRYVSHGFIPLVSQLREAAGNTEQLASLLKSLPVMFADRILKERPSVKTMYHCKIHDTALMRQFGTAIKGADKAAIALIMTVDGVALITQGMERGYTREISSFSALRKKNEEFRIGKMDFEYAKSDNKAVFAFCRTIGLLRSLVVINFSDTTQPVNLALAEQPMCCKRIFANSADTLSFDCEDKNSIVGELPAFGCAVFSFNAESKVFYIEEKKENIASEISLPNTTEQKIIRNADSYEITIAGRKICVDSATGLITDIDEMTYDNALYMTRDYSLSEFKPQDTQKNFDEGSVSGKTTSAGQMDSYLFASDCWAGFDYDGSDWENVFVPTTRQPYAKCLGKLSGIYIEDILKDSTNMLWSRSSFLRTGKCYFRKTFFCKEKLLSAQANFTSPALYDFDLSVLNGGINESLMQQSNPCRIFLNGIELTPGRNAANLIREGENIIAVEAEKGNGSHGIIGSLSLEFPNSSTSIDTDDTWKCFCGTKLFCKIDNSEIVESEGESILEFSGKFETKDNLSCYLPKDTACKLRYIIDRSGKLKISVSCDKESQGMKLLWNLSTDRHTRWFAGKTSGGLDFNEELADWSGIRNAYSGSVWPVWSSKDFGINESFYMGLGVQKNSGSDQIEADESLTGEIFSNGEKALMQLSCTGSQMDLIFS